MAAWRAKQRNTCSISKAKRISALAVDGKNRQSSADSQRKAGFLDMMPVSRRREIERTGCGLYSKLTAGPAVAARFVVLAGLALVSGSGGVAASMLPCSAPETITRLAAPTPVLMKAFETDDAIRIVAFGSSSTEGAGASAQDRTYPARLAAMLRRMLPGRRFTVINRGRGGELASDMLARLERDVISAGPTLVIWQTGVNDAIRGVDISEFQVVVEAGIARLKAEGSDVILLDAQYYPRASKVKNYRAYQTLLRKIGTTNKVPVFRRYQLMTHLVESGQYRIEELLAKDRFHQNDTSYDCLGAVIAEAIRIRFDDAARVTPENAGSTPGR